MHANVGGGARGYIKCARSIKSLGSPFFFARSEAREKSRIFARELDSPSRKGEETLSPLAYAVRWRGVTFRLFGKKHFDPWERFSHLKNIRRDETERGENPQSYPKTRKPTPRRGTWRAFAIIRVSRTWASMLVRNISWRWVRAAVESFNSKFKYSC